MKKRMKFFESWDDMRSKSELCDVTLVADNVEVKAHRIVLSAASRYFRVMFTGFVERTKEKIVLELIDGKTLQALVDYIYKDELPVHLDDLQDLLRVGTYFQLTHLRDVCGAIFNKRLSPSNCLGIYHFARDNDCEVLSTGANRYIQKHFTEAVKCDEFLSLTTKQVVKLVSNNNINTTSEEEVYDCVIAWINVNLSERKTSIDEIMGHVRLPLMSLHSLMIKVNTESLLKESEICLNYVAEAIGYHFKESRQRALTNNPRTQPRRSAEKMLVICGFLNGRKHALFYLNLKKEKWHRLTNLPDRRSLFGIGAIEGSIYVFGGLADQSMIIFNSATKMWSRGSEMTCKRQIHNAAVLNNCIYVTGGRGIISYLNTGEIYDPLLGAWTLIYPMHIIRHDHCLGVVDGFLYAIGGSKGDEIVASVERYSPNSDSWSWCAPMSCNRSEAGVASINGLLYVVGGYNRQSSYKSCEVYDPKVNTWSFIAHMSQPRIKPGVVAVNNLLYVVGGRGLNGSCVNSVEVYNPSLNAWTLLATDMSFIRGAGKAIAVDKPEYC